MEKRKCKLCPRTFNGGRALGGHMKSHLAAPSSSALEVARDQQQLADTELTESSANSSFLSSSHEVEEDQQGQHNSSLLGYGLRENPKRSVKLQDPEFSSSMDRGSETESTRNQNPNRKRSKRARKEYNKVATPESEQLSSVSDTSPEEDLAMCLMLLSRDHANWAGTRPARKVKVNGRSDKGIIIDKTKRSRAGAKAMRGGKFKCDKCMERYRSSRALVAHKRICSLDANELVGNNIGSGCNNEERIFECPYCFKLFGSGQALGGHKRSHLVNLAANNNGDNCSSKVEVEVKVGVEDGEREIKGQTIKCGFLDLNLPASPGDEDRFSVVLEA